MNSRKGGNPSGHTYKPSSKGKGSSDSFNPSIEQLNSDVSEMNLDTAHDAGWEVFRKKSKIKSAGTFKRSSNHSNSKDWVNQDMQNSTMRNHGGPRRGSGQTWPATMVDSKKSSGKGYSKPQSYNHGPDADDTAAATPSIPPPLKNGWGWAARTASHLSSEDSLGLKKDAKIGSSADSQASKVDEVDDVGADDESDDVDDTDDELMSDDFDSDASQKSHDSRKKNRWFMDLFESMDALSVEQISDPVRQWHCPACKGGPGAIDWYRGLLPLITHAKTKRSKRVRLHGELAEILDEELRRRGASAVPAGEMFGKWKGLGEIADKEIVWPPMVIIMNTRLQKDENEKWIGMGNQELLDYFNSYNSAVKARHSYGPQGHRGMSVLLFEASAVGYAEAERLNKNFEDTNRDRLAWDNRNRVLFYPGGKRKLYGYMAEKQDIDIFNQHAQGKVRLKYEMRSYQEMVVNQMKQMSEDNQLLSWFKDKAAREKQSKKALQESYGLMSEKLRQTIEENRIVKLRTKKHHEQNKEEMDYQENFFRDQIQQFYDARNAKEESFEKIQLDQLEKVTHSQPNVSSVEERQYKVQEIAKFVQLQNKEMEEFVEEREKLMKAHEERMVVLKRRYHEEEMALEKEFDDEFNRLMEKYTPK